MREFKKKTIALILASVVTVAGSFAAGNYKNSLMAISFSGNGSNVEMTVHTRGAYSGNVSPIRKDANTYVLMLPEIDSKAATPDLSTASGQIASVNIRTMPYTNGGNGYTRVTVKTYSPIEFSSKNAIYVPAAPATPQLENSRKNNEPELEEVEQEEDYIEEKEKKEKSRTYIEEETREEVQKNTYSQPKKKLAPAPVATEPEVTEPETTEDSYETYANEKNSSENLMLVLGILFILLSSIFFFTKGKNKLHEITGEIIEIDVESEDGPKKKNKKEKAKKTVKTQIKSLDAKYINPTTMPKASEYTQPVETQQIQTVEENIVDLDELFQEQTKNKEYTGEDENAALEDFLSGFSFDDFEESTPEIIEEGLGYDEEYYETTISNKDLRFSKTDIEKIEKLLNTEITDDTLKNIEKYAVSNPIAKKPSKKQILENLVTMYSISQNILFTKEDISALNKLISVEIDPDFLTDLKTNPERLQEMYKEMEASNERRKPSEILTLSVRDVLPDLSEALKKQGNKKIESNAKAETVYYSEGYEVSTLKIEDALPDLSASIGKADAYKFKPTEAIQYVDTTYEVQKFNKIEDLPNLQDVLAHPEKYATPEPEEVVVDENALLNNIANVQFKPFNDGSIEFERINNPEDLPSVSDIQEEFSQFENFEITEEEETVQDVITEEYDDFAALYSNEYFDLDQIEKNTLENIKEDFVSEKPVRSTNSTFELLEKINASKAEKEARKTATISQEKTPQRDTFEEKKTDIKCIIEGESFTVISSTEFANGFGCHLAKNEKGYAILGYIGDKLCKLKSYETLKSEKIHSRLSDNIDEETSRYLIRIGIHKFVVDVTEDNITYVMDLC